MFQVPRKIQNSSPAATLVTATTCAAVATLAAAAMTISLQKCLQIRSLVHFLMHPLAQPLKKEQGSNLKHGYPFFPQFPQVQMMIMMMIVQFLIGFRNGAKLKKKSRAKASKLASVRTHHCPKKDYLNNS